jgi:acetyl-CoA synthetase
MTLLPGSGAELTGNDVEGVLCIRKPWPGLMRTCYGDHPRFLSTYLEAYKGCYFTGDGARRDKDGFYWITGRVDDVLNTSGHRIGTAEVEAAICQHAHAAEAAVVGYPHDVKGEGIFCYVILTTGSVESPELIKALKDKVSPAASSPCVQCGSAPPLCRCAK